MMRAQGPQVPSTRELTVVLMPVVGQKTFLGETLHTCLLTPGRELTTDQSTETTKVQCGEPKSFIGASYRNVSDSLLKGVYVTQRQIDVSPKSTPA